MENVYHLLVLPLLTFTSLIVDKALNSEADAQANKAVSLAGKTQDYFCVTLLGSYLSLNFF